MQKLFEGVPFSGKSNFIGTFFIALFGSLLIVFQYAAHADWTIHNWNGVISWATSENLDVDRRIDSFYKAFGLFFVTFFFFLFVVNRLSKRILLENEVTILNQLSLAGCMLLFFRLIGADMTESLKLIAVIMLLVMIYAIRDFFNTGSRKYPLSPIELAWALSIGISLVFFDMVFTPASVNHYNLFLLIISSAALLFCYKAKRNDKSDTVYRWIVSLRQVVLIPLWIVLSTEIYMILNQHHITVVPQLLLFFLLVAITVLAVVRNYFEQKNILNPESEAAKTIFGFYFPWLLVGLVAYAFYKPVVEAPTEMFEQANPALSIQQYYEFGKLPWLQTFSSHSGADFITGFLYSMLNGFSGLSYHCYDFLVVVVYIVLLYYTLRQLTGNPYLAFLSVLIYPYINLLLPQFHFVMLVPLLVLAAILKAPTTKNYFFFFSCLILMPLWRYDLAYGNIIALLISLFLFMLFRKELRASFASLRKGFLWSLILPVILFVIALIKTHQSILITAKDALGYLNSAQAFGTRDLANEKNLVYFVHYFIFPCAVAVCFFFALYRFMLSSKKEEKPSFANVAVIFLSIYYIANFHRGLIRHNLAEGWDTAFSSFAFFIVTATVYDFLRTKNRTLQLVAVCAFASILLLQFKYPQTEFSKNNYYSELNASIRNPVHAEAYKEKVNRAPVKAEFAKETFNDLKGFLDKNIPADATFLDFSNTPMLYLYTHRQTPNYFNQIPHTALNVYLQQRFLEELTHYKIPVVLFSNSPEQWWDSFDGVPNTYRHYLIAEYIYSHYKPYAIINRHSVWLEKNNKLFAEAPQQPKDTISAMTRIHNLRLLPYIMGKSWPAVVNDSLALYRTLITQPSTIDEKSQGVFSFPEPIKNNEANYILIKAKNLSGKRLDAHLRYKNNEQVNGGFDFALADDSEEHAYLIRLSTQYNWVNNENNNVYLFMTEGKFELTALSLQKGKL